MSLYSDLVEAGVPVSGYYSDLYFQYSRESMEILKRHPDQLKLASWFKNQAPPYQGESWLDVQFAFDPFWDRVAAESARRKRILGE